MYHRLLGLFFFCALSIQVFAGTSSNENVIINELPINEARAVRAEITKLEEAHLDAMPVITKIKEGMAKNVPSVRIMAAVREDVIMRLRSSRMIDEANLDIPKQWHGQMVNSMVYAMRRGAQEQDLAQALRSHESSAVIQQSVDTLGIMAQRGLVGKQAVAKAIRQSRESIATSTSPEDITRGSVIMQQSIRLEQAEQNKPVQIERPVINNPTDPTGEGSKESMARP